MRKYFWWAIFTLMIGGISCRQQSYLPETGIVRQLGIEYTPDQRLLFTQIFPNRNGVRQREQIIISKAKLLHEARSRTGNIAPFTLKFGKLQQLLVSEQLARQDIANLLSFFFRDYQNPPQALLVVVDGSPQELLQKAAVFPDRPPVFTYVHTLLKNNYGNYLSELSVLKFYVLKFAPGVDPLAPVIKLAPDGIELAGTALFFGERLAGRINNLETDLLLLMMRQLKASDYGLQNPIALDPLPQSREVAAVNIKKVHRQLRFVINRNTMLITLALRVQGNVAEYVWDNLDQPEAEKALEAKISRALESDCAQILRYAQRVGSDPLGFGDMLRVRHYQYWKNCNWKTIYPKIPIKVKVAFKMEHYGMIR